MQELTFTGLMTAAAVVLSALEGIFPALPFMPLGSRLGLSNIAVMFSAYSLSVGQVLAIIVAKAFFVLITRGFTAFLMSLFGGLLSGFCMIFLFRKANGIGCVGIGILSALCHNIGQITVSFAIMRTAAVFGYAPVLIVMSVLTGTLTGLLLKAVMPYFDKMKKVKEMEE